MKNVFRIFFSLLLFCVTNNIFGQKIIIKEPIDSTIIYKVELIDGYVFYGNILQKDSEKIVMKTSTIPKMEIPILKIKGIVEIAKADYKKGNYWFPNPHATRYLFGPSAFSLKKREGYYQNTMLVLNSFNVGITDYLSIGAGLELISTFATLSNGNFDPIFFITPKVGFKVKGKFHAGGGVLYVNTSSFDSGTRGDLGIAYGMGTYGTLDHNITGGFGWGLVEGEFQQKPVITFSGISRIARKAALITENWFVPIDNKYYGVISYGVRFFGENMSVDLAFINNPDIAAFLLIGIPFVSFTVKF